MKCWIYMIRENLELFYKVQVIDRMKEDILIYQKYYQNVIICDARLIPELTLMKIKYPKCYTIHLTSDRKNNLTIEEQHHITETELEHYDNFDYKLVNISKQDLKRQIYRILEVLDD